MKTDITLYRELNEITFRKTRTTVLTLEQTLPIYDLPEVLFISSFPPRECGIATYCQDLINALNDQFESTFQSTICALESDSEKHVYDQKVKYILNTDERNAFIKMAFRINNDKNVKLLVIQHEFGFYENKEAQFKQLFANINVPILFVFHTVLPSPSDKLKSKVQAMAKSAATVIVMTENAASILQKDYNVPMNKIMVVPHGTHLVPPLDREKLKIQYQLSHKKVLSTFGLLGWSKNIETTLEALPAVIKQYPDVLFLILGKTHPSLLKHEGEKYRKTLEKKVIELNLEEHVRFVNEYLELAVLLEYLQLSDIYLFTSKDPNQAVSGTFSYAASCGCPVISTPIPHAKEVLSNNNGVIIDFESPTQLAKAIIMLLSNDKVRNEISTNSFQKMAATAWQNSAITHALLFEKLTQGAFELNYKIPPINLSQIEKMTTDFGMIQFSKISNPDLESGYALDDNARALIATCLHYEISQRQKDLSLIHTYVAFIKYCQQPNGQFLNYVNHNKEFTGQNQAENLEDSTGRAMWALGFLISQKRILPLYLITEAEQLIENTLPHLLAIHSTRAMAFIIKGLSYQDNEQNLDLLITLANRIGQMYKHEKSQYWHWFEDSLTYGNSLIPEAMLCAYTSTGTEDYKKIAIESFTFLLSKIFKNGTIKVISNKGWHHRDKIARYVVGGEQPIDVAYTIISLAHFYKVFNKIEYLKKASLAFSWFLGNNHLHQIVYNPCTGGCYDGVEEFNVNLNQGAESTLSYLMARLSLEKMGIGTSSIFVDERSVEITQQYALEELIAV